MPSKKTIIGHDRVKSNLERLFNSASHPHAFLFCGSPSGIGKRTMAMHFIAGMFCESASSACGICTSCRQIENATHPDFLFIGPDDKGTIPVGDKDKKEEGSVRWLISMLNGKSISGKRAVLIDSIDRASIAAQNALLKTIEEPSEGTVIFMTAPSTSSILRTIVSRSSLVRFSPLKTDDVRKIIGGSPADSEFAAIAGGGSAQKSLLFLDERLRSDLINFCISLKSAAAGKFRDTANLSLISGSNGELVLDGALSIYAFFLRNTALKKDVFNVHLSQLNIDGETPLRKIIKSLIFVKKGQTRNLNPAYSIKGVLYGSGEDPYYSRLMLD